MHLGNGVIFLVGIELITKEDVVSFSYLVILLPVSFCGDCQKVNFGEVKLLLVTTSNFESRANQTCLWEDLLPPPGERDLPIFAPFCGYALEVLSSGLELRELPHLFLDVVCHISYSLHLAAWKKEVGRNPLYLLSNSKESANIFCQGPDSKYLRLCCCKS